MTSVSGRETYSSGSSRDGTSIETGGARQALRSNIAHRPGWAAGGYQVMMNSCTRANRLGFLMLALTLVGLATGSVLFMTTSASAIAQEFMPMSTFNGVACASASQCIGVGKVASSANSGGAAALDPVSGDFSTGQSLRLIGGSGFLTGVRCPSGSVCLAVGENRNDTRGIAVPLNPNTAMVRSGQELQTISGIFMSAVACASRKQCLAVGHDSSGSGVVVALSPATGAILKGQRVQTIPGTGGVGLEGVTCPLANLCVAVGENSGRSAGVAVPLNPATGAIRHGQRVQSVTHKGILLDLACPSTTVCLAVGWGASQPSVAVPIDPKTGALSRGQSDRSISARAAMLTAVSCPSIALCLAVGNDDGDPSVGQAVAIDPRTATIVANQNIQTVAGTGALNAVVCHSTTQCVVAGSRYESAGAVTEILDPATGRRP
jgi:hypothetical protein